LKFEIEEEFGDVLLMAVDEEFMLDVVFAALCSGCEMMECHAEGNAKTTHQCKYEE
jgi:hypothetical protein